MKEFGSFGAFAAHLLATQPVRTLAIHRALEESVRVVVSTAKEEIGTYQDAIGAFHAWQALAESTQEDRVQKGYTPDDPLLRRGDMRDSYSGYVEGMEGFAGSNSQIAFWQETGTEHIPPRPVIGPAAMVNEKRVVQLIGDAVAASWIGAVNLPLGIGRD